MEWIHKEEYPARFGSISNLNCKTCTRVNDLHLVDFCVHRRKENLFLFRCASAAFKRCEEFFEAFIIHISVRPCSERDTAYVLAELHELRALLRAALPLFHQKAFGKTRGAEERSLEGGVVAMPFSPNGHRPTDHFFKKKHAIRQTQIS